MHLTPADQAVLEALVEISARRDGAPPDDVEAAISGRDMSVEARLDGLVEAGLAAERNGTYRPTPSARRALRAPGDGSVDDGIDTPPAVEETLSAMDLRADREGALRKAFAQVRNKGTARKDQIVAAVYEENPAGFDDRTSWWKFVSRGLDALAECTRLSQKGKEWHFPSDDESDGRRVLGR